MKDTREAKSEDETGVATAGATTLEEGKILPERLFDPLGIDRPNFCQQIEIVVCWEESSRICELS